MLLAVAGMDDKLTNKLDQQTKAKSIMFDSYLEHKNGDMKDSWYFTCPESLYDNVNTKVHSPKHLLKSVTILRVSNAKS